MLVSAIDDPELRLIYVNPAFESVTGFTRTEAIGRNCRDFLDDDRNRPELALIGEAMAQRDEVSVTLRNYRKDGSLFWNKIRMAPLSGPDGKPKFYLTTMRDVTEQRQTAVELERAASYDRLTGCLNRDAMMDRMTALNDGAEGRRLLLFKVDVASFSDINNGFGYNAGNAVLRQVAGRLRRLAPDALGRINGNEFSLAFRVGPDDKATALLARLQASLMPRFELSGTLIQVRFAIGYVIDAAFNDGVTIARRAGIALIQSKRSRLLEPCEYNAAVSARSRRRLQLTSELQRAVADDEFLYHYQPKVSLETGEVVGAEALLRWRRDAETLWMPDSFIALAEETGLIRDINTAGFPKIAAFAARINAGRRTPLNIAVNVSAAAFLYGDLPDVMARAVISEGLDPRFMTLELTENLMAESSTELLAVFEACRALGFGLSIDDFGTGYSSLRYLETFPITEIKIDRSFVSGMAGEAPKRIIADAVVKLGQALGIGVVAEGVETQEELKALIAMGCPRGQGYLFGKAMPSDEFEALVA